MLEVVVMGGETMVVVVVLGVSQFIEKFLNLGIKSPTTITYFETSLTVTL